MKEEIIKIRASKYLKNRAKDNASVMNWTLSHYIRFLLLMDIDNPIYKHIIPLVSENVDTSDKIQEFTYEGRRFVIILENQVKNLKLKNNKK